MTCKYERCESEDWAWGVLQTLSWHISWTVRHARHRRVSSRSASAASFESSCSLEDILLADDLRWERGGSLREAEKSDRDVSGVKD